MNNTAGEALDCLPLPGGDFTLPPECFTGWDDTEPISVNDLIGYHQSRSHLYINRLLVHILSIHSKLIRLLVVVIVKWDFWQHYDPHEEGMHNSTFMTFAFFIISSCEPQVQRLMRGS